MGDAGNFQSWTAERSRRQFLRGSAQAGMFGLAAPALLTDLLRATAPPPPPAACAAPAAFPASIPLTRRTFENWARDLRVEGLWSCAPRTAAEVVEVVNWARAAGWRVRASGFMHTWCPLTVVRGTRCEDRVLLVDTTSHLTAIDVVTGPSPAVRAGAGASLEAVLNALGAFGLGFSSTPAPGDLTVGGMLAVGAHGTGVPAVGEQLGAPGRFGSISGRVLELTVVAWDEARGEYALRTLTTTGADGAALQVALGRTFVVEALLRAEPDVNLRCRSYTDIPAAELFGESGRTFDSFIEQAGRVEAIWFAFTDKPWLKVWSVSPTQPAASRAVQAPYNYPFSDNIPVQVSILAEHIVEGNQQLTPQFGRMMYDASVAGLATTQSSDIWGASRNVLLYVRPTTLRVTANGYAVLVNRSDVQRAIREFTHAYQTLIDRAAAAGRFPIAGPIEIRVTGLDDLGVAGPGAPGPLLSAIRARPDRPDLNAAVWLDLLSFPDAPGSNQFYRQLEAEMQRVFDGGWALMRPEWSKGWGYTDSGAWSAATWLDELPAQTFRDGYPRGADWDAAVQGLNRFDPHRVFGNPFLDRLVR